MGVKKFSVGILDGAPLTVGSSLYLQTVKILLIKKLVIKIFVIKILIIKILVIKI